MNTYKLALSVLVLSILVACGGGNSRIPTTTLNKPKPNQPDKSDKSDKPNKPLPPTVIPPVNPHKPLKPIDTVGSEGQKLAIYYATSMLKSTEDKYSTWYNAFPNEIKYKQKNFNPKQQYIYMIDNGQKINIADLSDVSPVDFYNYKLNNLYKHKDPELTDKFITDSESTKAAGTKISTALSYARFGIIQTRARVDVFVQGQETPITAIPQSGKVKYRGDTIYVNNAVAPEYGGIELIADFGSKKITGSYQQFHTKGLVYNIAANIKGNTFSGEYKVKGDYTTYTKGSFFGPNAEEVSGIILNSGPTLFGAKQVK